MKDRIRQWMEYEGMNAAQFSKKVNINTSVLSHLLGGRNMPSYDIVQKIVANCPEMNIEWFITGNGPMIRQNHVSDGDRKNDTVASQESAYPSLFEMEEPRRTQTAENRPNRTAVRSAEEYGRENGVKKAKLSPKNSDIQIDRQTERPSARIRKIVIFYEDRTFEEFLSPFAERER